MATEWMASSPGILSIACFEQPAHGSAGTSIPDAYSCMQKESIEVSAKIGRDCTLDSGKQKDQVAAMDRAGVASNVPIHAFKQLPSSQRQPQDGQCSLPTWDPRQAMLGD